MSLYDKAMNGEVSALDVYIELRETEAEIKKQIDDIKDIALLELEKYGKEPVMRRGFLIEKVNGRKLWNYKGVSAWNSAKARLTEVEKMAQMAFNGAEVTDKETGEVVEPADLSFASDTIKITYKGQ
jgi:hypothetical protein